MAVFTLKNPKDKRSSVKAVVCVRGKRYYLATGVAIDTADWNIRKQRVRQTSNNLTTAPTDNETLDKIDIAINKAVAKAKAMHSAPTPEKFREMFKREYLGKPAPPRTPNFIEYMAVYIDRYRSAKSYNTTRSITTIYNKLVDFEKSNKKKITFKGIDMKLYIELSTYFASLGHRDSYFAVAVKVMKQVFREAREVDKIHNYDSIVKSFSVSASPTDDIYLSEAELRQIYDLDLDVIYQVYPDSRATDMQRKRESLKRARAFFLLGAYTGLRVSDFTRLKDANISDYIRIRTQKTNKEVVIPLHPIVREIINGDVNITAPPSSQKLNDSIKELARLSGIDGEVKVSSKIGGRVVVETKQRWELVSNHTARRSFATNAYKAGVPTLAIMKITGHTKESTFMKYIKITEQENAEILENHPFFKG